MPSVFGGAEYNGEVGGRCDAYRAVQVPMIWRMSEAWRSARVRLWAGLKQMT